MAPDAFYIRRPFVTTEHCGGLATLWLGHNGIPQALDDKSLTELSDALFAAISNPTVHSICITNRPGPFLAGVSIAFFSERVVASTKIDEILDFTRLANRLLEAVEQSEKRTVAWVQGAAIGAGAELALACGEIAISKSAKFAFPETSLGIYPGMGGTQRLPRRVGVGLAKWLIYTGAILPSAQAYEIGLANALTTDSMTSTDVLALLDSSPSAHGALSARLEGLSDMFASHSVEALRSADFPGPQSMHIQRALAQLLANAPLALRRVERVIDRGMRLSLAEGLAEEFAGLREIFSSADALLGLRSAGGKRPTFSGH